MALLREAVEPLYQSMLKWQTNATCKDIAQAQTGQLTCPLCDVFYAQACVGCPVAEETGQTLCHGTTYSAAHRARRAVLDGLAPMSDFTAPAKQYAALLEKIWRK
jgi:hypothetical protein